MPLKPDGDFVVANLVITKEQARRLRALRDLQKSPSRRVSLAQTAREVLDAGLDVAEFVSVTVSSATDKEQAA